jgi:hypothetical protein
MDDEFAKKAQASVLNRIDTSIIDRILKQTEMPTVNQSLESLKSRKTDDSKRFQESKISEDQMSEIVMIMKKKPNHRSPAEL